MKPTTAQIRTALNTAGNFAAAARKLQDQGFEISRDTVRRRLQAETNEIVKKSKAKNVAPFQLASPAIIPSLAELKRERIRKYKELKASYEATRMIRVRVNLDGPIGIGHVGDPHVDDDGTDIDLLFTHAELFGGGVEGLFAGCVGDVWNNWVGSKLARLWAEQSTSAEEAKALMTEYVRMVKWLYFLKGNHDCITPDVECLTRDGWKTYDQLTYTDFVFSLNPETRRGEWVPIKQKIVREHDGDVYDWKGQGYDVTMTPNHRVAYFPHHSTRLGFKTADSLPVWNVNLPASAQSGGGVSISDDEIRLAAWLMTDCHYEKACDRVHFYQSGDRSEITELLERLGFTFSVTTRNRAPKEISGRAVRSHKTAYEIHLSAEEGRRCRSLVVAHDQMPDWVFDLNQDQFRVFAEQLIACDGTLLERGRFTATLHKKREVLDQWQAAFITHGYRANISVNNRVHSVLNIVQKETVTGIGSKAERRPYVGKVWCLTVKHGNFMVRRNGQAHFTGNCWSGNNDILDWLLEEQATVAKATRAQIELVFPNGRVCRIYASHNFKGTSQWSPSIAPAKKAQTHQWADLYVCGHLHTGAYQNGFHADGRMWHALRTASYKKIDSYVEELDIEPCPGYECPVTIIDPYADKAVNFVRLEYDPFEAAERLTWMRKRWARGKSYQTRGR